MSIYLTKNLYAEHIKNSQNSIIKQMQYEMGNDEHTRYITSNAMAVRHMKRCPASLVTRQMQIEPQ